MSGPLYIDPLLYDDTELGSRVRDAHANGSIVVVMIPFICSRCGRSVPDPEVCVACGDEDAPVAGRRA